MKVAEVLAALPRLSVLVVGDVCLDRWCRYEPDFAEPSRETGLPRVAVVEVQRSPGGAGNVAANLAALGAGTVTVLGTVGDDGHAVELREALQARSIAAELVSDRGGLTFTYTKLINRTTGVEDLPRIDFMSAGERPAEIEGHLLKRFEELAPRFDVLIVSDQMERGAGGVVTSRLRQSLAQFAGEHPETVVWVDSRVRAERFRQVLVKLNEDEVNEACSRIGLTGDWDALRRHIGHRFMIVTRGRAGAVVVAPGGRTVVPGRMVEKPTDICGAGDSFNAGGAMALRITGNPVEAAQFGNLVASITVTKPGTGTASPEELLAADKAQGEACATARNPVQSGNSFAGKPECGSIPLRVPKAQP
jgi:rfaE bifunctional protein kinase chain/domain